MPMKLFHRMPKPVQYGLVGCISALAIVSVGLFVNALVPSADISSSPSNAEAASGVSPSGISVTPVGPDGKATNAQSSTLPSDGDRETTAATRSADPSIAPAASAPTPSDIDAYAEPYDDLPATSDLPGTLYNHFSYAEADPSRLESVGLFVRESYEREELLDYEASQAFAQMKADAEAEGIFIMPISGFRTIERQSELFVKQTEKLGSESAAAELSAPPGYSEHHTGYAIDIGDVNSPDTDIKYSFEATPAYSWLVANARRYGFEQSFPYGNKQGVSFEPWHWRYVGSERAGEVFINSRYVLGEP